MDYRVEIIKRVFHWDRVLFRVPVTYEGCSYFNHPAFVSVSDSMHHRTREIEYYPGPGEMFVTDKHYLFFKDNPYRQGLLGNIPLSKPYLMFHRDCLAMVDFIKRIIRLDEIIKGDFIFNELYGRFSFSIHGDFLEFTKVLGLAPIPGQPIITFHVPVRPYHYYTMKYPPSPFLCNRCGDLLDFFPRYNKYYCRRCQIYI